MCALVVGGGQLFYFIFRPAQLVPSSHPFFFAHLAPFFFPSSSSKTANEMTKSVIFFACYCLYSVITFLSP